MNKIKLAAYRIPCDSPESDGTIKWDSTTLVLVSIQSGGTSGLGFSYGHESALDVIKSTFVPILKKYPLNLLPMIHDQMVQAVRNMGLEGIASHAISAVDIALWDLKAKQMELPLCQLWGQSRENVPVYGSGGFTSYTNAQTAKQFKDWKKKGINKFKMKVGRKPSEDIERVKQARKAIGDADELFVDANGAYTRKQALNFAKAFAEYGVTYFEEPVPAHDVEGLHFLRNHTDLNIAAGEYAYTPSNFANFLTNQSVDILQADATRCGGYTGFFEACALSKAFNLPLSSHTAPSLHLHACLSMSQVCHMEYFYDHVRIEDQFFEGTPLLKDGNLYPHLNRFGHGLELKNEKIDRFAIRKEQNL